MPEYACTYTLKTGKIWTKNLKLCTENMQIKKRRNKSNIWQFLIDIDELNDPCPPHNNDLNSRDLRINHCKYQEYKTISYYMFSTNYL